MRDALDLFFDDLRRNLDDEGLFGDADVRVLDLHGVYRSNERILKGVGDLKEGAETPILAYGPAEDKRGSRLVGLVREGRVDTAAEARSAGGPLLRIPSIGQHDHGRAGARGET